MTNLITLLDELEKLEKKATAAPWYGCNHVKDHSFDDKCSCRQVTVWSEPADTIVCEKYENRDGLAPIQ